MGRQRTKIFRSISDGQFWIYLENILGKKKIFNIDNINFDVPISVEEAGINKEKRKLLYLKKRDLMLKLAETKTDKVINFDENTRESYRSSNNMTLSWDFTKNIYAEGVPEELIRCIKYSKMALKTDHNCLPRFVDLYRNGMGICLETTKNEVLLREIIGDRKHMQKMGSKIISLLLRALVKMD
jgi:hypothetical protein